MVAVPRISVVLFLIFTAPASEAGNQSQKANSQIYDATVQIRNRNGGLIGSGSGFIFSNNSDSILILTNHHVIDRSLAENGEVKVYFQRQNQDDILPHRGQVIGSSVFADVAVVEVDPQQFGKDQFGKAQSAKLAKIKPFSFGDSDQLQWGEELLTVGFPMGYPHALTRVHFNRVTSNLYDSHPMLELDGEVSPGNSGGPLLNQNGDVVGINSAILSLEARGIFFAIPINFVLNAILPQLLKNTSDKAGDNMWYGTLGVKFQRLTPDMMIFFGLADFAGAIVTEVQPHRAGDRANRSFNPGDVVTGVVGRGQFGYGYYGILFWTLFAPFDLTKPWAAQEAIEYEFIPAEALRQGKGMSMQARQTLKIIPNRKLYADMQLKVEERPTPPAGDLWSQPATGSNLFRLNLRESKVGVWIDRDHSAEDHVGSASGQINPLMGFLAEIGYKDNKAPVYRKILNLVDVEKVAKEIERKNIAEVLVVTSQDHHRNINSEYTYRMVALPCGPRKGPAACENGMKRWPSAGKKQLLHRR